jgi:hypothetical protein
VVVLVFASGCSLGPHVHTKPESRQLCAGDDCYRFGELPGWRIVREKNGEVAFFDDQFGAVAQINATCRQDAEAASLEVLLRHLLIGYTDVEVREQEKVRLAEREALHTVIAARLDGVPIVLDLYVVKRNGCVFDLSMAAPPERYPRASADFARFVSGFQPKERT